MSKPKSGLYVWRALSRALRVSDHERQWTLFTIALVASDAFAVAVSLTLAFVLRITSGIWIYTAPYDESTYAALTFISVVIWLGLFATYGLYKRDNLLGGSMEYQQVLKASTTGVVVLIIVSYLFHDQFVVSRAWLLLSWGLSAGFVVALRFIARRIAYVLRRRGWFTARVLIVGANDQGVAMAKQWLTNHTSGMEVIGFVDDFKPTGTVVCDGLKVIGHPTALTELVEAVGANEIVVVPNAIAWETFEEIIQQNNKPKNYHLRLSPGFYGLLSTSVAVTNKTFVPLFTIDETRIVGVDAHLKSLVDYGLGAILLAFTLPLQTLIAAALKMARRHEPVLSRFRTMGQGGVVFDMLKFNTPASADWVGGTSKIHWFDRVIYGKGLDKLPQLLNIMAGHMSLVGPRPAVINSVDVDQQTACLLRAVKPGVLGPWLVQEFWSSGESQDELYYVRNWTFWLDLQILVQATFSWLRTKRATPEQHPQTAKPDRPMSSGAQPFNSSTLQSSNPHPFASPKPVSNVLMSNWQSRKR